MNFNRLALVFPRLVLVITISVFLVLIFPLGKPFPYSDDWLYLPVLTSDISVSLDWFLSLHNDHRIPLQKIFHLAILQITGGDFRPLVLLNVGVAALTAFFWIEIACHVRNGRRSIGDAIIPLLFMHGGFNVVHWGFSFQFVSSIALISFFAWVWIAYFLDQLGRYGTEYAFLLLILCAWTGGNGILSSVIMGIIFVVACITQPKGKLRRWSIKQFLAFGLWIATIVGLMLSWKPSTATMASDKSAVNTFLPFLAGMSKSWLGVFAIPSSNIKTLIAIIIFIIGILFTTQSLWKFWRHNNICSSEQLLLLAILLQSFVIIVTVSVSRHVYQPWFSGLELHYGYLSVLIPVSAWIAVSSSLRGNSELVASILAIALVGFVYIYNTSWRIEASRKGYPAVIAAEAAILSSATAKQVANDHISEFYYIDTPDAHATMTQGILLLRQLPIWGEHKNQ